MSTVSTVTERNTKKDIYKAYQAALKLVQDTNSSSPDRRRSFTKTENDKVLQMTTALTPETIVKELGDFRVKTNEVISSLEDQMVAKKQKLDQIQTSIKLVEEELKNVHGVVKEADSLSALVRANEGEKIEFETEMDEIKAEWVEKTRVHDKEVADRNLKENEYRNREEEQYKFDRGVQRRDDNDKWTREKSVREESIAVHERDIKTNEDRFTELETLVAGFDAKLQVAVTEATEKAKKKADQANGFETRALKKDHDTFEEISDAKIEAFEEKVKTLEEANRELSKKLTEATGQVKDIAREAIQGAQARIVTPTTETNTKR